jgi:hypothetical protein
VNKGEGRKIVVLWNGASDRNILNRLELDMFQVLNITCYDKNFDKTFSIILEKIVNKEVIFELEIGKYEKTGRLLNLEETHSLICNKRHKITYTHDPRTDVRLTKCIFDYVVRKIGCDKLIRLIINKDKLF